MQMADCPLVVLLHATIELLVTLDMNSVIIRQTNHITQEMEE